MTSPEVMYLPTCTKKAATCQKPPHWKAPVAKLMDETCGYRINAS